MIVVTWKLKIYADGWGKLLKMRCVNEQLLLAQGLAAKSFNAVGIK